MGSAAEQGQIWGLRARDWAELQEPHTRPLFSSAIDAAGIDLGTHYLDAACGAGLALALAEQRGAMVHGVDASASMLELARERLPHADLRQEDLEELSFADDSFDAVTCFNGVQFAEDLQRALAQLRRVARPRAPVVVATWAEYERCDMRFVFQALASLRPSPPDDAPPPSESGAFALSAPGRLHKLLEEAGMRVELAPDVACPFVYPDLDTALRALFSAGPMALAAREIGEQTVLDAVAGALERFRQEDGSYRLENEFRYVLARA